MNRDKKINIINKLIADIDAGHFDAHDWLAKANNFLNKVFPNSETRIHQLKLVLSRPKYMFSGYNVEEVKVVWKKMLQSYIEEIELDEDEQPPESNDLVKNENLQLNNGDEFIDISRVDELKSIKSDKFDLSKLIKLCEEINSNYSAQNYYSVALLGRAIIDHVPPIFGHEKFNQVAAQHGGKSIKTIFNKLNEILRSIADHHIHQVIRKKEVHPNKAQIDFKVELDKLLAEIIQILG